LVEARRRRRRKRRRRRFVVPRPEVNDCKLGF
jgi:hypothetical protein